MDQLASLQMFQICDSLFPIGAFTLSNGLETFVCNGRLSTEEDLEQYISGMLQILPYNDLGVMLLAYTHAGDWDYIQELDELSLVLKSPMEVRNGCKKLCSRFLKIWEKLRDYTFLEAYQKQIKEKQCQGNHAIAVGLYAKEIGLSPRVSASIYVYSLLSAMVTNAVKTVPLSQISGQRILNQAMEQIWDCVEKAEKVSMDDLGIGGTEFDIAAMNHETLYSRLYMS